ncbi:MAG: Gldg family protein, partial [Bradymonadaceae bacterium]
MADSENGDAQSQPGVADSREGAEDVSRRRQIISGSNAVVLVLAAVGIAIVANAIASQVSTLRADLTEGNIYTLSKASRQAVSDLEQPVKVKAFISSDMPPPHHTLRKRVKALLTEYRAASGGKLDFQIIAPGDSKRAEKAARGYGCEKVGIGQRGEDKVSLRAVFKCVAFLQGEDNEVIKDLKSGRGPGSARSNFEYEFTKALMNLKNTEPRKVGFVAGFGGPADQRGFIRKMKPAFQKLFGDLIKPKKVDLSGKNPSVPDDVSGLVLLNPTKKVSGQAKFAIDQFLQTGGSVGWYQSATAVDKQMQRKLARQLGRNKRMPTIRKKIEPGLRPFFKEYGVELRQDLVLDRENALAMGLVMTKRGPARISHPATFTMTNIDQSLPFTRDFGTLALPAPSSIDIKTEVKDDKKINVYEVVKTADSAVRKPKAPTSLRYRKLRQPTENEKPGPFVVAAALQGDLPSYYADHQPPKGKSK